MGMPAHMWIANNQGSQIRGGSQVHSREGSIEIHSVSHNIHIPYDVQTGAVKGARKHSPITILKSIDQSSPYFAKACCNGETLKDAKISLYKFDDSGQEKEHYRYELEKIKVVSVSPFTNADLEMEDMERISLAYQTINWLYVDGNIAAKDTWNER